MLTLDFKIIVGKNIFKISPYHIILMGKTKLKFASFSKPDTNRLSVNTDKQISKFENCFNCSIVPK